MRRRRIRKIAAPAKETAKAQKTTTPTKETVSYVPAPAKEAVGYAAFYLFIGIAIVGIAIAVLYFFPSLRLFIIAGMSALILAYVAVASPNVLGFILAIVAIGILWISYAYMEGWFTNIGLPDIISGPPQRPPDRDETVVLMEYIRQHYCFEGEVFLLKPSDIASIASAAGISLCNVPVILFCYEANEYVGFVYPQILAVVDGIYKPSPQEQWQKLITGAYYINIPEKNKTVILKTEVYKRLVYPTTGLFDSFDKIMSECGISSTVHVPENKKNCILSKANWSKVV